MRRIRIGQRTPVHRFDNLRRFEGEIQEAEVREPAETKPKSLRDDRHQFSANEKQRGQCETLGREWHTRPQASAAVGGLASIGYRRRAHAPFQVRHAREKLPRHGVTYVRVVSVDGAYPAIYVQRLGVETGNAL